MTNTIRRGLWPALIVLTLPMAAQAQAVGGGAGSFLSGLLSWIQSNAITTLGTLAIIGAGLIMLSMRASWIHIIFVAAGIWIMFNAGTIISFLQN